MLKVLKIKISQKCFRHMLLSSKSKRIACCWSTFFRNLCSKVAYALSYLKNAYPEMLFYKKALGKAFIHSFIHYGDLYSAPSRLLLRSAPDPCTAKKKSFETRVECVRKNRKAYVLLSSCL